MRHWRIGDYLGGLFLGLIPASIFMLLIGHPWYALYLAGGAIACLVLLAVAFVVIVIVYDDTEVDWVSEPDRKLWTGE